MQYSFKKEAFEHFVQEIQNTKDFIAPIAGDQTKKVQRSHFAPIKNSSDIKLDAIPTFFPAKEYFFAKREVLFDYNGNTIKNPELHIKPFVIFGLRKCDLTGIKHQDHVFLDEHEDPFYKARREASTLIGLHCKEGDEYCFCNSVGLQEYGDVIFYDKGGTYAVETLTDKGEAFVHEYKTFFTEAHDSINEEDRKIENTFHLNSTDIKDLFKHTGWDELSKTCVSCGACNFLCPNCHCFTIKDETNMDLQSGQRVRVPASCQLRSFTRVAGDFVFRNERSERFKHRIYHQIEYYRDRHGEIFCTGCGRCIRGCPVKIDWVSKINEMKS